MDLASFKLLFSKAGQDALATAVQLEPVETDYLLHFQNLEKIYPPGVARAALETAILRREARTKFPQADRMFFTREALEQASPYQVSKYRTDRYAGLARLIDLGCSIGSDALNMCHISPTLGIDADPLRLAMAKSNADSLGLDGQTDFVRADLQVSLPAASSEGTGLFFDPARRKAGRRVYSVLDYQPPLDIITEWQTRFPALGVKLSPGVDKSEIAGFDAELEFVSLNGELKEALLWLGPLKSVSRRATILPGPYSLAGKEQMRVLPISEPQRYLYEPDAAVIRAGLMAQLGEQLDAAQLDPDIAYLTARDENQNPFSRAWKVEDWFPFNLKRLREYLRDRNVGQVTVKKRGSPIKPEELIQMLKLRGEDRRVVFLTHLDGAPITIVCFQS